MDKPEEAREEIDRIFAVLIFRSPASKLEVIHMLKHALISEAYLDEHKSSKECGVIYAAVDTGDLDHSKRVEPLKRCDKLSIPPYDLTTKVSKGYLTAISFSKTAEGPA